MTFSSGSFFISSYTQMGISTWRKTVDKMIDSGSLDTGTYATTAATLNVRIMATLCLDSIASNEEVYMRFNGGLTPSKIAWRKQSNFAGVTSAEATSVLIGQNTGNVARSVDLIYEPDRYTGTVIVSSYAGGNQYSDITVFRSEDAINRIEFYGGHSWATATYARLKMFVLS